MSKHVRDRKEYMTADQKASMGNLPRTHLNCFEKTGVNRPGKTKQDKSRQGRI